MSRSNWRRLFDALGARRRSSTAATKSCAASTTISAAPCMPAWSSGASRSVSTSNWRRSPRPADGLVVDDPHGRRIEADEVLLAIGRNPNTAALGLERPASPPMRWVRSSSTNFRGPASTTSSPSATSPTASSSPRSPSARARPSPRPFLAATRPRSTTTMSRRRCSATPRPAPSA